MNVMRRDAPGGIPIEFRGRHDLHGLLAVLLGLLSTGAAHAQLFVANYDGGNSTIGEYAPATIATPESGAASLMLIGLASLGLVMVTRKRSARVPSYRTVLSNRA
jgi:hypothetical protein